MKKRFILLFLVFSLICSFVPIKKTYAMPGVIESALAYKLIEGLLFTLGTGYMVKSGYEHLKDDVGSDWNVEDGFTDEGNPYFTVEEQLRMLNDFRNNYYGSGSDPEPEHDFLFPPMSKKRIQSALGMNDEEVVDYANQFYSKMAEHEKEKFLNNEPYKVNLSRTSISRLEEALKKPLSKLLNPDVYIDLDNLDVFSKNSNQHISSYNFPTNDVENNKKLTYFLNLAIKNKFDNIQLIVLGNPDLNGMWMTPSYRPNSIWYQSGWTSFIIASKGSPIVDFSDSPVRTHGTGYRGYDISYKDVVFDDEVLVLGNFRTDKVGEFYDLQVVQTRVLEFAFQVDHVSTDGVGYNQYIEFDFPSSLPSLEKTNILVPDIFNKEITVLTEFPETEEELVHYMGQVFTPEEFLDIILKPDVGEIEIDEDDEDDEDDENEFKLPSIFDVNLVGIEGVDKNNRLDFSPLTNALSEISEKFPFSLPWDLMRLISMLNAAPIAPKFEMDLSEHENPIYNGIVLTIDLAEFEEIIVIIRFFMMMIFIYVLIINTKLTRH